MAPSAFSCSSSPPSSPEPHTCYFDFWKTYFITPLAPFQSSFLFFFFFSFQSSYEYEEQRHILSFLPFSIRCVTPIILSGTILLPFLHCASFGSNAFCLLSDDHYEKVRVLRSTDLAYLFTTASPMPRVLSVMWWACWASQVALTVKNLPVNAGDLRSWDSIPGLGRSPGRRHSNPFQYSCLENSMDKGPWRAIVHRVIKSWTPLKELNMHN